MVEYQVKLRKNYGIDIMSGGIEYDIYDGVHYLNFDVYSCKGTGIDRYRNSDVYFVCKEVTYKLKEYSE